MALSVVNSVNVTSLLTAYMTVLRADSLWLNIALLMPRSLQDSFSPIPTSLCACNLQQVRSPGGLSVPKLWPFRVLNMAILSVHG